MSIRNERMYGPPVDDGDPEIEPADFVVDCEFHGNQIPSDVRAEVDADDEILFTIFEGKCPVDGCDTTWMAAVQV